MPATTKDIKAKSRGRYLAGTEEAGEAADFLLTGNIKVGNQNQSSEDCRRRVCERKDDAKRVKRNVAAISFLPGT